MKVLVTGGRGMLGTDVCAALTRAGHRPLACGSAEFDIVDPAQTSEFIGKARPNLVIHTAAYTDVDGCERDPERAFRINAEGAGNIAAACAAARAELIAISTDFVFDGSKRQPYLETDTPNPLGAYGASKLAGENLIREFLSEHKIVRTSWLYGIYGKCFPKTIITAARAGKELRVIDDQIGSPTYTPDLAEILVALAQIHEFGIFHACGSGACTWYELASEAIALARVSDTKLAPISADDWPSPTARPMYSVLSTEKLSNFGVHPMRDWRSALADYVLALG